MYRLTCFGEVSVLGPDQQVIRLRSQKHIALLTYLAANRRCTHDRDALASLLWSTPIDRARHSLSQALYDIRKKLDAAVLQSSSSRVRFATNHLTYDGHELEEAVRTERFAAAVNLYEGGFAPGLDGVATGDFERWVEEERRRLDELARIALHKQIDDCYASGRWSEMYVAATKLVRLDPLEESAHRAVIQALWLHGDQHGALRHYDKLVGLLNDELNATPGDETTTLVGRIRGSRPTAVPSAAATRSELPLIGRSEEFGMLQSAAAAIESNEARLVYLDGEAGIGKTRLVREFARSMGLTGLRVLTSRCYSAESDVAYQPVLEGIREVVGNVAASEGRDGGRYHQLGHLFPEYPTLVAREVQSTKDPEVGRRRMYEEVADVMRRSFGPRTVWIIEDIHWIDASSASLLHYLLRRLRKHPMLLVLTARRHVELTEAARKLLDDARSNLRCDEVALAPLGSPEIQALIRHASTDADQDIIEVVNRYAGGNPFYAIEIARSLVEAKQSGAHQQRSAPITPQLRDLLALRVSGLDRDSARLLESVAVLERYAEPTRVSQMAGLSLDAAAEAATPLYRRRLLIDVQDILGFPHDIVREFVYDRLGSLKRTALHLRAGELLSKEPSANPAIIARHYSLGGERKKAYIFAMRAAESSAASSAHEEAARMAELASTSALASDQKAAALKILAQARFALAHFDAAARVAQEILECPIHMRSEDQVRLCLLAVRSLELSRPTVARRFLSRAAEATTPIRRVCSKYDHRLEVLHWTLRCAWNSGDVAQARAAAARIERLHREARRLDCLSPAVESKALCSLAAYYTFYESSHKALSLITRASAFLPSLSPAMRLRVLKLEGVVNMRLLRHEHAEQRTRQALEIAVQLNDTTETAVLQNNLAATLLDRAEWTRVEEAVDLVLALERTLPGYLPVSDAVRINRADSFFYQGNASAARHAIDDAIDVATQVNALDRIAGLLALKGLTCLQVGDTRGAKEAWKEVSRQEEIPLRAEPGRFKLEWFRAMMSDGADATSRRLAQCAADEQPLECANYFKLNWLHHLLGATKESTRRERLEDELDSVGLGWFAPFTRSWIRQVERYSGQE